MNILRLAFYDLLRMSKDRMLIFWMLIMPLGFVSLFGSVMRNPADQTTWLPVVNLDEGELSSLFIKQLDAEKYYLDVKPATHEVYVKNWYYGIIIPATFTASVMAGEETEVIFVKRRSTEHTLAAQARLAHAMVNFTGAIATVDVINNRMTDNTKQALIEELNKPKSLVVEKMAHEALHPPPYGYAMTLTGYIVMFVFMNSVLYGGITLAMDKSGGQYKRLHAAPLSPTAIFVGKMAGRMLMPLIQAMLLLLLGSWLFGISMGEHPIALVPIILSLAICAGSLGVMFGAIFSTEQQIFNAGMLTVMILSALGGCWWPLEIVPEFFKQLATFSPTYWGLHGLQDVISFGKALSGVMQECLILLFYSGIFLLIARPFLGKNVFSS